MSLNIDLLFSIDFEDVKPSFLIRICKQMMVSEIFGSR